MAISEQAVMGLELFKSLIKDGCQWHGDVTSRKWSECLYVTDTHTREKVGLTLQRFEEGTHYRWDGEYALWIC